jgi:hypothetical protein
VKKLKSLIASHCLPAWILALVVAGYPFGIAGAQNLAAFFVLVFMLPLQCLALSDRLIKDTAMKNRAPLGPPLIKRAMMCTAIVIAAWHGAFWTASGALLYMVLGIVWTHMHNTAVDEIKAEEMFKAATRPAG